MKILNRKDIQALLGLSESAVYRLLKDPTCPLLNCGGQYRIVEEDLIDWLRNRNHK